MRHERYWLTYYKLFDIKDLEDDSLASHSAFRKGLNMAIEICKDKQHANKDPQSVASTLEEILQEMKKQS